jgi:prepilin-type processing-associated H-X9-DG protein
MNCAIAAINDAAIPESSAIVLLVDEAKTLNDGFFWAVGNSASTDALTQAHLEGGNLLYADGHVKFQNFKGYPLDNANPDNKTRTAGIPRFHDLAFGNGALGTANTGVPQADGTIPAGPSCPN